MKNVLLVSLFLVLSYSCNDNIDLNNDNIETNLKSENAVIIPADAVNVKDYGATGDGTTSDSEAILKALKDAQDKDVYLYFPAGTYNLNQWNKPDKGYTEASVLMKKGLKIIGDGSTKTAIVNSGNFWCTKDISIRNIKIHSNLSIFLSLEVSDYVNISLDDMAFTSDNPGASRFINYFKGPGVEDLSVTNCHFSRLRYALILACNINKGYIANNIFTKLGDANIRQNMGAISIGSITPGVKAKNIVIENNKISDMYVGDRSKGGPAEEVYALPIMVYGQDIIIRNNRIENTNGAYEHEGIYVKAKNVRILNNTLINAGEEEGSICAKSSDNLWVEGNTIYSDTPPNPADPDFPGIQGIMLMCDNVVVKNNKIDVSWGWGIRIYVGDKKNVTVEGNEVKTKSFSGISVENFSGNVNILNNIVEVNSPKADYYYAGIFLNKISGKAVINIKNNVAKTENCRALSLNGTAQDDYFLSAEITGNMFETISIPRDLQACNLIDNIHQFLFSENTITQNPSMNYTGKTGSMLSTGFSNSATPGAQEIYNNRFIYNGNNTSSGIRVSSDKLSIRDNQFQINSDGMESFIWWIGKTNSPDKNAIISGNKVKGKGTIKDLVYLDLQNPVNLGTLIIEKNSFNLSGHIIFPVTKWSNHIIADEIIIRNNKIGTKSTGMNVITDSAHSQDVPFTQENNELYPNGVPEETTTGIPVIGF